jgi:Chaperone of endosialidase
MATLYLRKSISRSPLRLAFLLIPLALACFALSPTVRAVSPPPDGGYPGANTAEGDNALLDLTTGTGNTANGNSALLSNTTGNDNTASGFASLVSNTTGNDNTAIGSGALPSNTTGSSNTANGRSALFSNTTGDNNTANGFQALQDNTAGGANTANGFQALFTNTNGHDNTAIGHNALQNNKNGNFNVALGANAGFNLTTGSNNIDVGNNGVAGESQTIRIGTARTQTQTFIAGISGVTVPTGIPVIVDVNGHLGTTTSSSRFKEAIKPMDKASEAILALKPVTFRYKHELDPDGIPQFGLVAEQVEKVNPDLVVRDEQGKPYTVRYEAVNAMLLNEFLKEHKALVEEHLTVEELKKQVAALTMGLQKVSAELEASKPAPQVVNNP